MHELDGAAAGGQFLRSALTLSAITKEPVRIIGIRGDRDPPGLRPQHLTGVNTIARICRAETTGVQKGSETITFTPESPCGTAYTADIGTAGSVTLLFDLILPLATVIDEPLRLTVTGGTDVKWAPTIAYHNLVKLPLLRTHGLHASVDPHRTGYYPAGGGRATLTLAPSTPDPFSLTDRGTPRGIWIDSVAAEDLRANDVAERQADAATAHLQAIDPPVLEINVRYTDSASPGTSTTVCIAYEHTRVGGSAIGERGRPAEDVGTAAARTARDTHESPAIVDAYLADQLLLPLTLAGGTIVIPELTDHVETSLDLLDAFDRKPTMTTRPDGVELSA